MADAADPRVEGAEVEGSEGKNGGVVVNIRVGSIYYTTIGLFIIAQRAAEPNLGSSTPEAILAFNLLFLLGREVVLDVEHDTYLLWRLAGDHFGDSMGADVKQALAAKKVGSQDELE
jgi:hypothetical protein